MESASFDAGSGVGYNAAMYRETKTVRFNMWMKPSIRAKLRECAAALRLSEADAIEEAIKMLRRSKEVRKALAVALEDA